MAHLHLVLHHPHLIHFFLLPMGPLASVLVTSEQERFNLDLILILVLILIFVLILVLILILSTARDLCHSIRRLLLHQIIVS